MTTSVLPKRSPIALLLLISMLMLLAFPAPIQAAGAPNVLVASGSGQPGDTVSLTMTLENRVGVAGVQYVINYDNDVFSVDNNDLDDDGTADGVHFNYVSPNFPTSQVTVKNDLGQVNFAQARSGGAVFGSDGLCLMSTIDFQILPGALPGNYAITVSDGLWTEGTATTALPGIPPGQITVTAAPDTTKPVITLTGDATVNLTVGDTFTDPGVTATDNKDGDITANVVVGGDTVDTNTAGTYVITYNVSDAAGNPAIQVTRTVVVTAAPDTTKPVITLTGAATINLTVGDTFTDPGVTATDNKDGDITANVVVGGDTVDTNTAGTYVITYNVSDAAGNPAVQVTRTVVVTAAPDTTKPVITLTGNATINLTVGDTFTDPGVTATDNKDGNISASVVVGGDTVDTTTAGTYVITYNVSDAAGNAADQVTRTVIVAAPALTLSPLNPPHGQVGIVYSGFDFTGNVSGGVGPYTFSTSSNLPAGLTLSPQGVLAGTPTEYGNVSLDLTVIDSQVPAATAQHTYYFNIVPAALTINEGALNAATQGVPYEFQLATVTAGGTGTYNWSISFGALPAGLSLNPTTGYLTGIPTAAGNYSFDVMVNDNWSVPNTATASYTLVVNAPVLVTSITVSGQGGATTMLSNSQSGSLQMLATVLPANATNQNVTWSVISGTGSAYINPASGLLNQGTVGTVTVRATAQDGSGVYDEAEITIIGVRMSTGGVLMLVDSTYQLSAEAVPADTTTFTWESNNPGVATVDNNGLVTAVSLGTATITAATADGRIGYCIITVSPKPLATMADLTISEGTLTPAFDSNIYDYTAKVANSVTSVTIAATPWGGMAVSGDIGTYDLSVGANTFEINVDGDATHVDATYTIVITRAKDKSASSSPALIMTKNGGSLGQLGVSIQYPEGTVDKNAIVTIGKTASSGLTIPDGSRLVSDVFVIDSDYDADFNENVTLRLTFDLSKVDKSNDYMGLYRWNGDTWVLLDNVAVDWSSGTIKGDVDQFGKFAVLATALTPPVTPVTPLWDIVGHWAESAIRSLVTSEAISGYPDGTFRPDNTISRAEFASIIVKAFNIPTDSSKLFADTAGHWAQEAIASAYAAGIIGGYDDMSFGPDDPITREQMAVMIVKAKGLVPDGSTLSFNDQNSISPWASESVAAAAANQLISGYPDNTFRGGNFATRAEAVMVITQALK